MGLLQSSENESLSSQSSLMFVYVASKFVTGLIGLPLNN